MWVQFQVLLWKQPFSVLIFEGSEFFQQIKCCDYRKQWEGLYWLQWHRLNMCEEQKMYVEEKRFKHLVVLIFTFYSVLKVTKIDREEILLLETKIFLVSKLILVRYICKIFQFPVMQSNHIFLKQEFYSLAF